MLQGLDGDGKELSQPPNKTKLAGHASPFPPGQSQNMTGIEYGEN